MKTLLKQSLAVGACTFALLSAREVAADNIYRLYNPSNHEHLYTRDANEYDVLYKKHGWGQEGVAWVSPGSGTPVYRLYNAGLQNHLYTSDLNEISVLTSRYGWVKDNAGQPVFYSGGSVAIYRVYNAGLRGLHHWTTDANEYNTLPAQGWQQEGVKFNAVSLGKPQTTAYAQAGGQHSGNNIEQSTPIQNQYKNASDYFNSLPGSEDFVVNPDNPLMDTSFHGQ